MRVMTELKNRGYRTREFARTVAKLVDDSGTDADVISFIRERYRSVLLTEDETQLLNRHNRSRMTADRLAEIGIKPAENPMPERES